MVVEGTLTHPCPGFAVGKLAMVVVRVQGAPLTYLVAIQDFLAAFFAPTPRRSNSCVYSAHADTTQSPYGHGHHGVDAERGHVGQEHYSTPPTSG